MPVGDLEEEEGSGKAEDEEVAVVPDGTKLEPSQYGNNTPIEKSDGKRQRRLSLAPAGVWVQVKRLKDPHMRKSILACKVSTHVCILCWARLTLTIDKRRGCYLTTNALQHMREVHKEDAKASQERGDAKEAATLAGMIVASGTPGSSLGTYVVTPEQLALSETARFLT